jgi:hypothetical protein
MKKLPIGTQAFEKLRNDGSIYIDKTEHIYNLINNGFLYIFFLGQEDLENLC